MEKNYEEALKWFRKSAAQNNIHAIIIIVALMIGNKDKKKT